MGKIGLVDSRTQSCDQRTMLMGKGGSSSVAERGMGQSWSRGGKDDCLASISLVKSGMGLGEELREESGGWDRSECRSR